MRDLAIDGMEPSLSVPPEPRAADEGEIENCKEDVKQHCRATNTMQSVHLQSKGSLAWAWRENQQQRLQMLKSESRSLKSNDLAQQRQMRQWGQQRKQACIIPPLIVSSSQPKLHIRRWWIRLTWILSNVEKVGGDGGGFGPLCSAVLKPLTLCNKMKCRQLEYRSLW